MLSLLPQQETVSRLYTEDREGLLKMVAFDLTSERCKSAQSCNNLGQEHSRQRKERVLSLKVGTGLRSEEEGQCDCVSSLGRWVVNEVREGGGQGPWTVSVRQGAGFSTALLEEPLGVFKQGVKGDPSQGHRETGLKRMNPD